MSYQLKKPAYKVSKKLYKYLIDYSREVAIDVQYQDLLHFEQSFAVYDSAGKDTLWETVIYSQSHMEFLNKSLKHIYLNHQGLFQLCNVRSNQTASCGARRHIGKRLRAVYQGK